MSRVCCYAEQLESFLMELAKLITVKVEVKVRGGVGTEILYNYTYMRLFLEIVKTLVAEPSTGSPFV